MEEAQLSLRDIVLTAAVAGVAAYAVLSLAARELREGDRIGIAVHLGLGTFSLRFFGNIPALNDDFLPAVSPNACLGFLAGPVAALVYWAYWPLGGKRPCLARAWRWGLLIGVVGLIVNAAVR